jgi:ferredoxin
MVKIDKNRCVGCGICVNVCPQGFKIVNRKAIIENENANCITKAANSCPRGAIILEENKNQEEPTNTRQTFRSGLIDNVASSFGRDRNFGAGRPINPGHRGNRGRGKGRR